MNVNSFQDHENVTPCQALHKPIMGQALAKHWPSIGQDQQVVPIKTITTIKTGETYLNAKK